MRMLDKAFRDIPIHNPEWEALRIRLSNLNQIYHKLKELEEKDRFRGYRNAIDPDPYFKMTNFEIDFNRSEIKALITRLEDKPNVIMGKNYQEMIIDTCCSFLGKK